MENARSDRLLNQVPRGFGAVIVEEETQSLATRISENEIQANTSVRNTETWIRLFKDGRTGLASGTPTTDRQGHELMNDAVQAWEQNDVVSPVQLPKPATLPFQVKPDSAIIKEDPAQRASLLRSAVDAIQTHNLVYTGSFTSNTIQRRLVSTSGARYGASTSLADASCTVTTPDGSSGWARHFGTQLADVDLKAMVRTAGGKALNGRNAVPLKAGKRMVILEPAAVGSMLLFLGFLSFGGGVFNRGTSFLSGKIGEKVLANHISISDDASDPHTHGWPFDYEGTTVQPVTLIDKGFARGVVHDMSTAAAAGGDARSTGHALAPGNGFGPYPRNVKMAGGSESIKSIVKSLDQAVLVTRLWYINYANPMRTMITGTTRDGTFLMEQGKMVGALRNMRFVESILDAFSRSLVLSRETRYVRQFGSTLNVPYMIIPDFNFTEVI